MLVRTLDKLIEVCDIDTNEWDVEKWECGVHEMGSVPRAIGESKNWSRKHTNPVITPLYTIRATLKKKTKQELWMRQLAKDLVTDIRKEVRRAPKLARAKYVSGDYLFEFSPFDLHVGKLAWGDESGANYDSEIAVDLFDASLDYLLRQALKAADGKLDRVLCVFGNDVSHIDSKRADTTHGTRMDADTRYIKIYRRICAIHRRAVDVLRQVAPVDIVIVPGNHDELTSFHLGEVLAARYETEKHVSVDNGPNLRKYYEYGINGFGFTHGDKERVSELPLTMAREQPELFARCSSREWHIGHLHKNEAWKASDRKRDRPGAIEQDLYSDKGIRVRRLSSLSGHDAWHTQNAYMDRRTCEAFVFHRSAGYVSTHSFNVDHLSGKVLSK